MPGENVKTFRWLGVAGVELTYGGRVLMVDPYLTRFGFLRQWVGPVRPDGASIRAAVPRCDVVLVTHSHWDHLMDVPEIVSYTGATVIGSPNTLQLLTLLCVPPQGVSVTEAGQSFGVHDFLVRVFEASHPWAPGYGPGTIPVNLRPPLRARDYRMDRLFRFHVEVDGIALATEPGDGPWQAQEASVLLVSPRHAEDRLVDILQATHPRTVIPYHWDDMYRPLSQPLRPMMAPPTLSLRFFGRMDLRAFHERIRRIDPRLRVFYPEVLRPYPLEDLVGAES